MPKLEVWMKQECCSPRARARARHTVRLLAYVPIVRLRASVRAARSLVDVPLRVPPMMRERDSDLLRMYASARV